MLGPLAFDAHNAVAEKVLVGALAEYKTEPGIRSTVVLLKLLVTNAAAGAIIGRAGTNRDQLSAISGGCRIQLSRPLEWYPGTNERVLVLTGTLAACLTTLWAIAVGLGVPEPDHSLESVFMGVVSQWKLVLPSVVCGFILGPGGQTVRAITQEADASISISAEPLQESGLPRERIATISGGLTQTVRAVGLIVDKLAQIDS
ncbi:hypothetical protein CHLRE_08g379100v5 [Chlamydomonas reinhardtii]|uniref:K Homology domain-containing protein n=1 Tax=Chlamydomonas reinhardtii TaxID=3055 RepID=A0A2K3DHX2_CHLRE|nr:uncharacterized protein CHLRE_08g379100v5 [Chlamydomonas reinhardtii]PNW80128.1 hypothetical protein CHLRE_08g379100v5 [Chlamydomonas reinhardtii]